MKSHNNWLIKILHYAVWWCFIILVSIACVYSLYLFPRTSDFLTDADIIQLPTIFLDLQVDLSNFWGWKLPEAPYYFPDTIVFLAINWLVKDSWRSIFTYSLVQACCLIFSLWWIYRATGGKKIEVIFAVLLGAIFTFTNIYTQLFSGIQGFITPYIYYLCSYIHFGTYICCLICLAASLSYIRNHRRSLLLFVVAITLLTTASDLLFAIYFTIPFIAATVIAGKIKSIAIDRNLKRFCYLIFSASFIAYIFNKYFDSLAATTTVEIKLSKILASIKALTTDLWQTAISEKIFLTFTVFIPLLFLLLLVIKNLQADRSSLFRDTDKSAFKFLISLYVILAASANLGAVLVLGKYTSIPHARYLTFVYYSPGLIFLILIAVWLEKIKHINKIAIAASVTIAIIAATSLFTKKLLPIAQILPPPNYATCFNLNKPQAGLAGYWESKPLVVFSQRKIQVATINEEGQASVGNNNRYWYTDSWAKPGTKPQFEFILIKSLNRNAIASHYGKPNRVQACADSEIWWYDNSEAVYAQLMRDEM